MKICITSSGPKLDSSLDPHFGRCGYLLFIETDTGCCEALLNSAAGSDRGAGIAAAQAVVHAKAAALVTGNIGPKAAAALASAGIKVYKSGYATAAEALALFRGALLEEISGPTVPGHFGSRKNARRE